MNKKTGKRRASSRERGLLGSMMLIPLILIVMSLVSLGVDYSRLVSVRAQLRNAADAAALGGAMQLFKNPSTCDQYAIALAQQNLAENVSLDDNHSQVTVTSKTVPPSGNNLGTVTVDISMNMQDVLSPIFNRYMDAVHVTSVAGGHQSIVTQPYEDILFPLAVSLDSKPGQNSKGPGNNNNNNNVGSGKSLLDAINGDKMFTIYLNSQQYKNGAFTSFTEKNTNANWIEDAIAKCLDITGKSFDDVTIPSVQIGVDDIYLANGILGEKQLAGDPFYSQLTDGRVLILPVINGDPAYNQSRLCIGMVAVKVLAVSKDSKNGVVETLTVQIVDQAIPGVSGTLDTTGNAIWDNAIAKTEPKMIRLLR
jgi:Flp pilus assembly protein TadG